jgi:DNA mismatch repair protein MutH
MQSHALPPRDLDELRARVARITGMTLGELARAMCFEVPEGGVRGKGKAGELLERALGATGGSQAVHDFPALSVELKTVPTDARGRPRESTYVCRLSLTQAEHAVWETSWVRQKLSHVLWIPILTEPGDELSSRRILPARFWRPTREEEAVLQADFDELMGIIGRGGIEALDARVGRALQVRPKAASGRVRTLAFDDEGGRVQTVPRGFYLRAGFTEGLLGAQGSAGVRREHR